MSTRQLFSGLVFTLWMLAGGMPSAAVAGGTHLYDFQVSCSNGHDYALRPRAVTVDGDVVTGRFGRVHHQGRHVRLIPMGVGYRYAGKGIWLDGVRGQAVLHLSKRRSYECMVWPG
jgi:hypothetical protein